MKKLSLLMKELESRLLFCKRCGMCQAVCPLFAETGRETDVARGKLALLDGLTQEMFKDSKGVFERLNRCLLCGSCAANCPCGVNVLEIFIKARAILTGFMGLSQAKKIILRGILAYPETFDRIMKLGFLFQKLFSRPTNEFLGTSCSRLVSPLTEDRHFKTLAPTPFHRMTAHPGRDPNQSGLKAGFFSGCLIDKVFPQIAQATVDILNYHKIDVFIPEKQGCCGMPAISSGDMETFEQLVRYNLEKFDAENFDYLVTSCATCAFTIREIWPMMIRKDSGALKAGVKRIAKKTLDINRFLVSKVGIKESLERNDDATIVTYHDPCHLKKSLGISDEPRILIKANPDYRLKEMAEADRCCGLGGNFNLQYYEISAGIGRQKCNNIKASGCSVVATGCPACMIQISDMLSKSKEHIAVKHPVEIYAESLNRKSKRISGLPQMDCDKLQKATHT